jgi:hypothetical protein
VSLVVPALILLFWIAFATSHSTRFGNVEIRGNTRFKNQVVNALVLLKSKSPDAYAIVTNYIGIIEQAKHSGMKAYAKPPTFHLNGRTAYYSVTWCASAIAHDSFHSKLFHDYLDKHRSQAPGDALKSDWGLVPDHIWIGEAAEKQCVEHQLQVLREIGAPGEEIIQGQWNPTNRYWELEESKQNW